MAKKDRTSARPRAAAAPLDRARQILTEHLEEADYGPLTDPPDPLPLTKQEAVAVQSDEKTKRAIASGKRRR